MGKLVFGKYLLTFLFAGLFLPISIGAQTTETPSITTTPVFEMETINLPKATVNSNDQVLYVSPPAHIKPEVKFFSPFRSEVDVYIIRTLDVWRIFYELPKFPDSQIDYNSFKAPAPPVDFQSMMIIVCVYQHCFDQMSFKNFSMNSTGPTLTLEDYQVPHVCFSITDPPSMTAIAVPTTKLPISTWNLIVRKDGVNN